MIFQHTIDKVLSGEKTQTRRIVKPNQVFSCELDIYEDGMPIEVYTPTQHTQPDGSHWYYSFERHYTVGKTYALQRGRGVKAEGRIRITDIRREDVRNIREADVKAEGFASAARFFDTWVGMHDHEAEKQIGNWFCNRDVGIPIEDADHLYRYVFLKDRPAERYQAWAITFELVKESDHASK